MLDVFSMNISVSQISNFVNAEYEPNGTLFPELTCSTPCALAPCLEISMGGGGKNEVFNFFHFVVSKMRLDERIPNLVSKSNWITFDTYLVRKQLKTCKIPDFVSF